MNLLPVFDWPGFFILGLIPPLIFLLYFLKLRRTPLEVPSTYLWARTIEDLHVNSLWQKLRKSLLLFLQLALALLLLLACLRPGCQGEDLIGERFIFLIDQSSSMSATDVPGGKTRLEFAKEEIRNLIDRMDYDDSGMIIGFSNTANVIQSYTRSKSLLRRQLDLVKQTNRGTDIKEALSAASGLANPGQTSDKESDRDIQVADALNATLYIFSDGGIRNVPDFSLGNLTPEYHSVGGLEIPNNVGISAFSLSSQLDSDSGVQAFVQLQNSDDEDHSVTVELFVDGDVFDVRSDIEIKKESTTALSFDFGDLMTRIEKPVPLEIHIKDEDVYMADNIAFGVLEPPKKANVLIVTASNRFLEIATGTELMQKLAKIEFQPPRFLKEKEYIEAATLGLYDLVIFDQCSPEQMPECNTTFIGTRPPTEEWEFGEKQFPTNVIDTDISHPLMDSVSFGTVNVVESSKLTGPKGTLVLIDATFGPVMSIGPRQGFQDLVIGFSLLEYDDDGNASFNTDWVKKLSFPIFVQNVVSQLAGGFRFNAAQGFEPGELVKFRTVLPTQTAGVTAPDGKKIKLSPRPDKRFVFTGTEAKGVYEVEDLETESLDQLFVVNLFDFRESDLSVRDTLEIGYQEIKGTTKTIPARKDFWSWIIFGALALLMIEWYIYNRRVFI